MTVSREELFRAACASSDDTERLVYADWLEQQGDVAHAQAIHLQCELARTGRWDRRRLEVEWELAAVLAALGTRWADHLPLLDGVEWLALERGLPAAVRVRDDATLAAQADAILAAAPSVHTVELMTMRVGQVDVPWLRTLHTRRVAANALLQTVPELVIEAGAHEDLAWIERTQPLARLTVIDNATIDNELAASLARSEWPDALVRLDIPTSRADGVMETLYGGDPRLDGDGADQLATLASLEVLTVDGHALGAAAGRLVNRLAKLRELSARDCGITKLTVLKTGARLVRLDLSKNELGSAGVATLAKSPRVHELAELVLDTCEIDSNALQVLATAPCWQTLRVLDLSRNPLGPGGARVLAAAAKPAQLHTLRIVDADFEESAATILGKIAWLGELAVLDLSGNLFGRGGVALRELPAEHLRDLRLATTGMQRTEAAAIARFWPRLVHLDVSNNAIGDAGIERFATTKEAAALQTLRLADCKLGDDGLDLLSRARCPRLRALDLGGNHVGAAALENLLRAPIASHLVELDLSRCALDGDAIAMLCRTPMPPRLARLRLESNELGDKLLVALAEAPTLRTVARIDVGRNAWVSDPDVRDRLSRRFGAGW